MAGPTDATRADRARFRREVPIPWGAPCPRCTRPMQPGQVIHVGHAEDVVDHGPGPMRYEHGSCNQRAGDRRRGRNAANKQNGRGAPTANADSMRGDRCWCGENCTTHIDPRKIF